nr:hypothetical protein [Tanacetum cinerariifolium]
HVDIMPSGASTLTKHVVKVVKDVQIRVMDVRNEVVVMDLRDPMANYPRLKLACYELVFVGMKVLENCKNDGSSSLLDDEEEEDEGGASLLPLYISQVYGIHNTLMIRESIKWNNGLRVCLEDVYVESCQEHNIRHESIAIFLDVIYSENNHGGRVPTLSPLDRDITSCQWRKHRNAT